MNPVALSLAAAAGSTLLILAPGIALAWVLERSRLPGRGLLQAAVLLPLVLPPVVTGYALLSLFTPRGPLGAALAAWGVPVAFHALGAVVAAALVGLPFIVVSISLALKAIDPRLETLSRSLGRTPWETFRTVTLPLAWPGILAGAALAFARGLGEFGATMVLAGHVPGETETIPLAIFAALERPGGEGTAMRLSLASIALCFACAAAAWTLDRRWRRRLELDR